MPDLIAQGADRRDRWRKRLPQAAPVWVGRECGGWSVGWDPCVSRQHVQLCWDGGDQLSVSKQRGATNPIYFQGRASNRFQLGFGQHFVIGETSFTFVNHLAEVSLDAPRPASQQTFSAEYLRHASFRHAKTQIQALSRLPEIVSGASSNDELFGRLIDVLLTGVLEAQAAAVVRYESDGNPRMQVLHWDRIDQHAEDFQPSGALIQDAFRAGENVVHFWHADRSEEVTDHFDWALCSPIPGVDCRGQAIYVAGRSPSGGSSESLQDAVKFVELVGTTVGSVCDVRRLQHQATALSQFFSAPVRDAVAAADPDVALAPRETEVTVLFCDLRGFSRRSEEAANNLTDLLQRVSEALGIMTHQILDQGGVIGDFHGDAAMGFWGWPMRDTHAVAKACQAALRIEASFENAAALDQHALTDFKVGMGLCTGRAVAGKIGTVDQVKVTAFGPVVNLAARLEGMTGPMGVSILTDAATVRQAGQQQPPGTAVFRQLFTVRPYGMESSQRLYQLTNAGSVIDEVRQTVFEAARDDFASGNWEAARQQLEPLAAEDGPSRFLLRWMSQHGDRPPAGWDGIIRLRAK